MRSKCAPYREAGEIRDRTTEGQHYRIAGLNLLTAVIIYWNTVHLGHAVTERRNEGLMFPEFLPHISPLGWAHILTDWRISLAQGTESLGCHFALSRNRPLYVVLTNLPITLLEV